ncbi:MAG: hypothetical protein OSB00_15230 [Sphingomonas bacterium]|nr:hypothetical protein [Sphingomonas bacterium]
MHVEFTDESRWHLYSAVTAARDLVETGIFNERDSPIAIYNAIATRLLVDLNDALMILNAHGHRITATGPDIMSVGKEGDITSLINHARAAACHITSKNKVISDASGYGHLGFAMIWGAPPSIRFGATPIVNPYPDDVALFWGKARILVRRNLMFALDELAPALSIAMAGFGKGTTK